MWSSCFLLKDPRDIALAMENADDSDSFFLLPQVVEANILEILDGPRAQSFQAGAPEMPGRARLGIPADEFRRLIERQQKPDHEVFTAFSRIILRDSFRILICCWRRDLSAAVSFRLACVAVLSNSGKDGLLLLGPVLGDERDILAGVEALK